jgi:DUF1365 family protein
MDYSADVDIVGFTGFPLSTLFALSWTTITVFWSIFTPPHKTFAARVLLFQPAWLLRGYLGDASVIQDLTLFLVLHSVYSFITGSWTFVAPGAFRDSIALKLDADALQTYFRLGTLLGVCCILAGVGVVRGQQLSSQETRSLHLVEQKIDESILPPLLIRSRTTHSRMFPKKHSFSYSYLYVGIPIGIKGRIGNVLSVDSPSPAWFDIRSADYLDRSTSQQTLGEKLKQYLHTQGVDERDYEFAYLVTAPRFLGYSFNPVSFWYLYDEDTKLKYMVLEVNNTFDERRMYLLKAGRGAAALDDFDVGETKGDQSSTKTVVFTNSWSKDFHVSPFNSRNGSYSLRAVDPLASLERTGRVQIDNTIVLKSSENHPKIIARVFSTDAPLEPTTITALQLSRFIATWWWVGLATLPRILWEAQKLFFRRKLEIFYRPEVTSSSIGRPYTDEEWDLEEFFRAFLIHTVETSREPLRVIYEPAHNAHREIVLYSPTYSSSLSSSSSSSSPSNNKSRHNNNANNNQPKPSHAHVLDHTLTIKILTPAFYTRLLHHPSIGSAFEAEGSSPATHEKARTALFSSSGGGGPGPQSMEIFLRAVRDADVQLQLRHPRTGWLESLRWGALKGLRCPPAKPAYPRPEEEEEEGEEDEADVASAAAAAAAAASGDVAPAPPSFSELDRFMQHSTGNLDASSRKAYLSLATKLFLAERYAGGLPAVIDLLDALLRGSLLLAAMLLCDAVDVWDPLRPNRRAWVAEGAWGDDRWRVAGVVGLAANAVHLWRALKG